MDENDKNSSDVNLAENPEEQPEETRRSLKLPIRALVFDVLPFILVLLIVYVLPSSLFNFLILLVAILSPFAAIIIAVYALILGKKAIGKSGIVISIIAIAIPVITVVTLVILFRTGVAYIRWM